MTSKKFKIVQFYKKLLISFLCVMLVIFGICMGFAFVKNNNKIFIEKKFYFVYVASAIKQSDLKNEQSTLKNLGGAGYILKKDDIYHLVANVYSSKNEAEEICESLKVTFECADILEVKTIKIKNNKKLVIRQNIEFLQFIKFYNEYVDSFLKSELQFLAEDISVSDVLKILIKTKLEFSEKKDIIENLEDTEMKENILTTIDVEITYIDNFINNFFDENKANSLICNFACGMAQRRVNLFDCL